MHHHPKRRIFLLAFLSVWVGCVLGCLPSFGQRGGVYIDTTAVICKWYGGARAAVSVTFDDNCVGQFSVARPIMSTRNLQGTFFVNTQQSPCNPIDWAAVRAARLAGNEIGGHSETHPNLRQLDSTAIVAQLRGCADTLRRRFPDDRGFTFAWPFGEGGGSGAPDQRIRRLAAPYFLAARNASSANGYDDYDAQRQPFYQRPGANYYMQVGSYLMNAGMNAAFGRTLGATIAAGGWCTPLYHAIETGGYNNVPAAEFAAQMDTIARLKYYDSTAWQPQLRLWPTTFGQAMRYHRQRACTKIRFIGTTLVQDTGDRYRFAISDTLPDSTYRMPMTVKIAWVGLRKLFVVIRQSYGEIEVKYLMDSTGSFSDTIQFDVDTQLGDFYIDLRAGTKRVASVAPFVLWPQPAHSPVVVRLRAKGGASDLPRYRKATLYDLAGHIVAAQDLPNGLQQDQASRKLAWGALPAGVYIMALQAPNAVHTARLVVQ